MAQKLALIFLTFLTHAVLSLTVIAMTVWGSVALYYQLSESRWLNALTISLWGLLALAVICTFWFTGLHHYRKTLLLLFTMAFAILLIWWHSIAPSLTRDWAPEVSQTVTAEIDGNRVRLNHIRDFDWRTEQDFTENWKSADYNLDQIKSVDLLLSYWAGPAIAHTLVSFGFEDGRHVVFSAEIRKKRNQGFSEIGGFFKQFELAMIAAEESDIVYLRTNVRGERVYRYPIDIEQKQAQQLFLLYTDKANRLSIEPAFYNTITANCTTVVFDMAKILNPSILFDYRIILSGFLPEYIFDNELVLTTDSNAETMRLNANINALAQGPREGYSQRIRAAPAN